MSEPNPDHWERVAIVAGVLRWLAEGWLHDENDRAYVAGLARRLERMDDRCPVCPLCEETDCDDGCPLRSVRGVAT